MRRSQLIKDLINEEGYNMKSFSEKIDMPYTTLHSILKRGVGNSSVDNIIDICEGLGITIEELENYSKASKSNNQDFSQEEINLIKKYRQLPENKKSYIQGQIQTAYDMSRNEQSEKRDAS